MIRKTGYKAIGFIVVIVFWQFISFGNFFDKSLFASPIETISALSRIISSRQFTMDIGWTLLRMLAGYFSATLLGVIIGLIIGSFASLYKSFEGVIDFFRSIPVTSLYPVFVLLLGIDHLSKIGMVFWACFFVITLNSSYGVLHSSKMRKQMAYLYGASKWVIFRKITFYEALPQTLIGLRVGISYAIIVEILCEMFMGSHFGIGQKITEAFTAFDVPSLFSYIIIAGLIGYILNVLFVKLELKLIPWISH